MFIQFLGQLGGDLNNNYVITWNNCRYIPLLKPARNERICFSYQFLRQKGTFFCWFFNVSAYFLT